MLRPPDRASGTVKTPALTEGPAPWREIMNNKVERSGLSANHNEIVMVGLPLNHNETVVFGIPLNHNETVMPAGPTPDCVGALYPNHNETVVSGLFAVHDATVDGGPAVDGE
jgi:hypothetical protein